MSVSYTFTPNWNVLTKQAAPAANPGLALPWYSIDDIFVPVDASQKDTSVYSCISTDPELPLVATLQSRKVPNVYTGSGITAGLLPNLSGQAIYVNVAAGGDLVRTVSDGADTEVTGFRAPVKASIKVETAANVAITPAVLSELLALALNFFYKYSATGTANADQMNAMLRGSRALPL